MRLLSKACTSLLILAFTANAFAECEYEKENYRRAKSAYDTSSDVGNVVSVGAVVGGAIAAAATGNLAFTLIGFGGGIPAAITNRLKQLKEEREDQLKKCEEHEAFLAQIESERKRQEYIATQTNAAAKVGARLFMEKLPYIKKLMEDEINALYDSYIISGRLSQDPSNPTDPKIYDDLQDEEKKIRAKYF